MLAGRDECYYIRYHMIPLGRDSGNDEQIACGIAMLRAKEASMEGYDNQRPYWELANRLKCMNG